MDYFLLPKEGAAVLLSALNALSAALGQPSAYLAFSATPVRVEKSLDPPARFVFGLCLEKSFISLSTFPKKAPNTTLKCY